MLFLFLTTNAQISKKSNFFQTKAATEFLATHGEKIKKANRIAYSEQISKSVHVPTAGTLVNLLTPTEKSTVTELTVTGNLDARDFRILRDSMVNLTALDISAVTIVSYSGYDGTNDDNGITYPANEIPENAFYSQGEETGSVKSGLSSILLPSTVTSVGSMAFTFCSSLTSVSISASVIQIGLTAFTGCSAMINVDPANPDYSSVGGVLFDKEKTTLIQCPLSITGNYEVPSTVNSIAPYGFCFCDQLSSVNVPSSVSTIGLAAFTSCSGLINIDTNNPNYTSRDGVLFNKSLKTLIQCPTSKSGSYIIPSLTDTLSKNSFYNCSLLTAVTMPSSISYIADLSFYNCSGLTSITVNSLPVSLNLAYDAFYNANQSTCILNVPYGTKSLYQSATVWSKFTHIVENTHGFILGTNKQVLSSVAGSSAGIKISTNDAWTAVSNQNWLKVGPENGLGNDTILVTAEANPSSDNRIAIVIVSVDGIQSQTITITQAGLPKTINSTAGGLSTNLSATEQNSIINLKITGTLDARDFKTMRDNMPKLSFLDISEATISAYNGSLGTASWITTYSANRIPDYAFNVGASSQQYTLTAVKLPETINAIGDNAFYSCEALTGIVIPNSVTYIGTGGFGSCYNLANVVLPNQLTSIESQAFMGCGFSDITIPNTVKTIANYGFSSCRNLRSMVIPNSVTNIASSAFESCIALTDLTFGSSVRSIGYSAFKGCSSLAGVVLPDSVTFMDGNVFAYCTNLKTVVLSNSLTNIGTGCFQYCTKLTNLSIPYSVTKIDDSSFSNCISLTNIEISNAVTSIGRYAFQYSGLTGISIGNFVTLIGNSAFGNCVHLSTVSIPNSVTSIESYAFNGCTGLTSIQVNRDIPLNLTVSSLVFKDVNKTACILNVPFGTKNLYASANQWQDFVNIAENAHGFRLSADSVKLLSTEGSKVSVGIKSNDQWSVSSNQTWLRISPETGTGNDSLIMTADANVSSLQRTAVVTVTSGDFSKKITVIQAASPKTVNITAGGLVTALTTVELSTITNLTISGTINARDFKIMRDSMPNLETVDLSNSGIVYYTGSLGTAGDYSYTYPVNEIPQSAFFNSNSYAGKILLKTIILPASATSIGSSAFQYCTGLTGISIPNSVTSIGGSAFQGCSGLTGIKIPDSLTTLGDNAFQYCSGLTGLIIPDSLTSINWYAFSNCTNLKSVTLGKSLATVNYSAFKDCTSLTNVIMKNSLKTIGDHTFDNTGLTNLIIPESVTSIGYSSFGNCKDLAEVVLPNSLIAVSDEAFSNCSGLKKITLGNTLTTIKSEAFYNCTSLTSIVIPESVISIESSAFYNCSGLRSITTNPLIPVDLSNSSTVFSGIDKSLCTLNVPYQTRTLYSTADQWKDFGNIIENPNGLKLDLNAARLSPKAGSSVDVNVISNTDWKSVSNQTWLTVSSVAGSGNKLITLTADENVSDTSRMALVTVSVAGVPDKTITITQAAAAKTIQVTAGGLSGSLSPAELSTVSNLILTGTIDARDFKTMRDNMPLLEDIDLSGTTVLAYTGTEGTYGPYNNNNTYPAAAIPQYAFYNWYANKAKTSLISINLPTSVVSIEYAGFEFCSGLFSVKLPETLTSISDLAFHKCIGLTDINLPNSLLILGNYSFNECNGLKDVKFGNSITTINSNAFENCSALRSVALPNSVTTLGVSVFQYCTSLSNVSFGNSMTNTGNGTFRYCSALKNIVLSNSVITIGSSSFEYCTNLASVTLGNLLTTISGSAFGSCSKLETIVIPNTVTTLDFRAFEDCTGLKNITLSNSLTTIGGSAFWNCTGLTDIVIPNSVTTIGDDAFTYCSSLKSIEFGNRLSTIAGSAFSGCSGLVDVVLPKSVTTIGDYAFSDCNGMKSITIPAGISSLGYNSISCSGLTAIYSLASSPITPGSSGVFSYVSKATCVLYVPSGSKTLYQATAQWKDFTNIIEMPTAVPALTESKISIYPNPVKESFSITGLKETVRIILTDLNGKQVVCCQAGVGENVPVGYLSKGVYIVRIVTLDGTLERKFIKE
jgi:hypothetical protein